MQRVSVETSQAQGGYSERILRLNAILAGCPADVPLYDSHDRRMDDPRRPDCARQDLGRQYTVNRAGHELDNRITDVSYRAPLQSSHTQPSALTCRVRRPLIPCFTLSKGCLSKATTAYTTA